MISFRYHLTTLVAVFLALAVGVVLGGGPLSELGRTETTKAESTAPALAAAKAGQASAEAALNSAAPTLYGKKLTGVSVAVLRLPGVTDATEQAVAEQIKAAGGTSQVWQGTQALAGAGDKALVDTLGAQLAAQMPEGLITTGATTYDRIGELIGVALASTKKEGDAGSARTSTILDSLRTAKLVTGPAVTKRSAMVLVLAADPTLDGGVDLVHQGLLTGLATQSLGTVLATDTRSALAASMVDKQVSTTVSVVDGVENEPGQVAATLALVRSLTTKGGSFGATGADGSLPLL